MRGGVESQTGGLHLPDAIVLSVFVLFPAFLNWCTCCVNLLPPVEWVTLLRQRVFYWPVELVQLLYCVFNISSRHSRARFRGVCP